MLIIGSQALRHQLSKIGKALPPRKGQPDLDILCTQPNAREFIRKAGLKVVKANGGKCLCKGPDGMMIEFDSSPIGSSNHLYLMYTGTFRQTDTMNFYGVDIRVAPLEVLYSIKRAHRHSPRQFHKHIADYHLLRAHFQGVDVLDLVTSLRYRETVEREKLKTPSLEKGAKDFFDDTVSNKTFVHDQIHEVMAFYDRPMFERILKEPGKSVACSKEKFNDLPFTDRLRCVQEEAYVIALERAMIPMLFEGGPLTKPEAAYQWAVMRICTTLCSGWFREFAVDHYDDLIYFYDEHYVEKFLRAVEAGEIRRIEKCI